MNSRQSTLGLTFLLFAACSICLEAYTPPASPRVKYNFNPGWRVTLGDPSGAEQTGFNDSSWKEVTTPYAYNEDDAFQERMNGVYNGVGWYRKRFRIPAEQAGRKIFLEFEGIRQAGEFYLNGSWIGRHENGVTAFGFDISERVNFGNTDNVLAVRIDNSYAYQEQDTGTNFQWNSGDFNVSYGGITGNVYLHVTDSIYQTFPLYTHLGTTGIYIYASNFDISGRQADLTVDTELKNDSSNTADLSMDVVICNPAGDVVQEFSTTGPVSLGPGSSRRLSRTQRVANLNFWSWGYGYLYDVYTIIRSGGSVVDVLRTRTGFRKTEFRDGLLRLNDNIIHIKGYAQRSTNEWPALGDAVPAWLSDFSNRLMVDGNANTVRWMHVTPSKQDVESCDRVGLIEAMPAGDKESDAEGRQWEQRKEVMRDSIIYNRNNPSILFYEAGNTWVSESHMQEMKSLRDQYDPHGGRAAGSRNMMGSAVAEYGGDMLYVNKSRQVPLWAMEYSRDEGSRRYWDEYSPPYYHADGAGEGDGEVYNRNQDSHALENIRRWYDYWRERPGTGTRVNAGGVNIIFSDSNTHYRGEENFRRSGETDAMRLPKENYFANKVMWNGWVDVFNKDVYIIGHWNYPSGTTKDVYVASNCDKVELFINGSSRGFGERSSRFLFTFRNISWEAGEIRAVGYTDGDQYVTEQSKRTAGGAARIRLSVEQGPAGFKANGSDVVLVMAEVTDADGNRVPTAANVLSFNLQGPAEWRGGIAVSVGESNVNTNYILETALPVECGVTRVILRSTTTAGNITLSASASGLSSASLNLTSQAVSTTNGLSQEMPDSGLAGYLKHSVTPPPFEPRYLNTQISVNSTSASGGTASDGFDDNESTTWSGSWLECQFSTRQVAEIAVKTGSMRTSSYPVRVLVDGQTVYTGTIPANLGYYRIPFGPVSGSRLRIESTSGTLKITEMDLFEPAVRNPNVPDLPSSGPTSPPTTPPTAAPTSPPVGPGTTITLQAEDAYFSSGVIETEHTGYTGSGYVNVANEAGAYIEWTVNLTAAASATCSFVYANGASGARPADLGLNGSVTNANLDFPSTGEWTSWSTLNVELALRAGSNTIRLTGTVDDGLANFDRLELTIAGSGNPDYGDVDGNGSVTIVDALMTAQYYVGLNPAGFVVAAADVNCDGSINIVDALMIAQYYVGLLSAFNC